jgi:hypothetical protein
MSDSHFPAESAAFFPPIVGEYVHIQSGADGDNGDGYDGDGDGGHGDDGDSDNGNGDNGNGDNGNGVSDGNDSTSGT